MTQLLDTEVVPPAPASGAAAGSSAARRRSEAMMEAEPAARTPLRKARRGRGVVEAGVVVGGFMAGGVVWCLWWRKKLRSKN